MDDGVSSDDNKFGTSLYVILKRALESSNTHTNSLSFPRICFGIDKKSALITTEGFLKMLFNENLKLYWLVISWKFPGS